MSAPSGMRNNPWVILNEDVNWGHLRVGEAEAGGTGDISEFICIILGCVSFQLVPIVGIKMSVLEIYY